VRLGSPGLATPHLRKLALDGCMLALAGAKAFRDSPHLARLTSLSLVGTRIGSGWVRQLAASPVFANLRSLDVSPNHVPPGRAGGSRALASSPRLARLVSLNLAGNPIGIEGGQYLARSPHLARLRFLAVDAQQLDDPTREELRGRFAGRLRL